MHGDCWFLVALVLLCICITNVCIVQLEAIHILHYTSVEPMRFCMIEKHSLNCRVGQNCFLKFSDDLFFMQSVFSCFRLWLCCLHLLCLVSFILSSMGLMLLLWPLTKPLLWTKYNIVCGCKTVALLLGIDFANCLPGTNTTTLEETFKNIFI